jgi:hypothetical protein
MPGCPASAEVDRFKWVEPSQPFDNIVPQVGAIAFLLAEVAGFARLPVGPSAIQPPSTPLYLSHCSLVI